jgi:hypothetical protein
MTWQEELRSLADAMVEGTITEAEAARLAELLRGNPEAQRDYLRYLDLEASLHVEMRGGVRSRPEERLRPWKKTALAAAALLMIGLAGLFALRAQAAPAVLARSHEAVWSRPSGALGTGAALRGGGYRLEKGIVEVRFSSGVTALIEGPSAFELSTPLEMRLQSGKVVCRADPGTKGFAVQTSKAEVLDLGTEFGVRVGEAGRTEVQVYEGEVITRLKGAGANERRLLGGQAVDVDASLQEALFRPGRFVRTLPGPNDPKGRGQRPYNLARYDELHIVPAPPKVTIDADLSDWDLSGRIATACEPPFQAYALEEAWMFDEKFLYVGGHVGDPYPMRSKHSPEPLREAYGMGGCVSFRISTDRRMGWPLRGEGAPVRNGRPETAEDLNDKLCFVTLWYYEPEKKPCLHLRYGMNLHGTTVNPPGYRGAFRRDADGQGYTFEYAIPWEVLHARGDPPRAGDVLGAMVLAHWSDALGQTWQGQLIDVANPSIRGWNYFKAATWGRAVYHAAGSLPPGTVRPIANPFFSDDD